MEVVYAAAYNYFQSGKYAEAEPIFAFLCFNDLFEKKFWLGLGACRQMLGQYDEAVQAYGMAAVLDVEDPDVHLHAADCLLAKGDLEGADSALSAASHWAGDNPTFAATRSRAETILDIMQQNAMQTPGGGDA